MKKVFLSIIVLILSFSVVSFGDYVSGTDYVIDYKRKSEGMADTLHINFITTRPPAATAERLVMNHLAEYGKRVRGKNIIGSAWFSANGADGPFSKIKFNDTMASYAWISATGRVVTFSAYIAHLKKVKDNKRIAARAKSQK
ncbi:MAG: hypothetical protein LBV16_01185 [Elusimicrobiota bacterium]|jgi:hypothetical protein|nr:hypothetical protein [Elusimicrobiota bacterium]